MRMNQKQPSRDKAPRRRRRASEITQVSGQRRRHHKPTAAQLVRQRGYSARPWRCAVLAVDTATRSGWSFRVREVQSAFGEVNTKDAEAVAYIVTWARLEALRLGLVVVLVLESAFGGGREVLLALGAARERWLAAWRQAGLAELRTVQIMPARWRRHVLGPAYVRMQRDEIRAAEQEVAARYVGEPTTADESAAILIGIWAERAPEVGDAIGINALQVDDPPGDAGVPEASPPAVVEASPPATLATVQPGKRARLQSGQRARVPVSKRAHELMSTEQSETESQRRRREWSQWYTPPGLAQGLWAWACKHETPRTVLEPCVGEGALILPILADPRGCTQIVAVDIDARNVRRVGATCRALAVPPGVTITVHCGDFRAGKAGTQFDLCLMNPPYEKGLAEAFILHALTMARRVCGVFKASILHGQDRYKTLWRLAATTREVRLGARPSFGESEAGNDSPKTDYVLLEIVLRDVAGHGERMVEVETWA
jgi:predicted RNA methylase